MQGTNWPTKDEENTFQHRKIIFTNNQAFNIHSFINCLKAMELIHCPEAFEWK